MKEIKFRMWVPEEDGEPGHMISGDCLAFEEYMPLTDLLSQEGIMQYTGLKDSCDTEIYEGDILGGIGIVIWIPEEARFGIECAGEIHEITFEELQQSQMEIIGNIYDNPGMAEEYK